MKASLSPRDVRVQPITSHPASPVSESKRTTVRRNAKAMHTMVLDRLHYVVSALETTILDRTMPVLSSPHAVRRRDTCKTHVDATVLLPVSLQL